MKKKRNFNFNPSGSIADIAFLLLIFFMVATSFHREQSISMILPPEYKGPPGKITFNRIVSILINEHNEVMIEDDHIEKDYSDLITQKLDKIITKNYDPVIHLKIHANSDYQYYIKLLSSIKESIKQVKHKYAIVHFNIPLNKLNQKQYKELIGRLGIKISESQFPAL